MKENKMVKDDYLKDTILNKNVDDYLNRLKKELKGSDPALIQDALSDAEEHLRFALDTAKKETPNIAEAEALVSIIDKYGSTSEVAAAYKKIETHLQPVFAPVSQPDTRPFLSRYFSIIADPRAWGAFLYMIFSVLTGSLFGLWGLFGSTISFVSLILVIGIPITGLFLLSVRGIALIEGRIAEALLGVRMPRKPVFIRRGLGPLDKFKSLIRDPYTWKSLAYLVLMFPLGWFYFGLSGFAFALALSFIFAPILELIFHLPLELYGTDAFTPVGMLPIVTLAGIIMIILTLHLAKFIGRIHGLYAKYMLVKK
ncbi:MAG: hypothetical protein GQ545_11845 [Candidatus Aminicenantes bacterium]|nr:hypothetical protein [Candidatus Aminicenantes bacterium]